MIRFIPIQVESHSGYKADEYPKLFYIEGKKYEISEITDRWYQCNLNPEYPAADYFKIMTSSGDRAIIRHELQQDAWYLIC